MYTYSLFQMLVAQGKNVSVPEGAPALNVVAETGPDFGGRQNAIAIKSGRERPAAVAIGTGSSAMTTNPRSR